MINNPSPPSTFLTSLFNIKPTNDGHKHYIANTTLTADLFALSIIIDAGVTLKTDNYRIYCLGSLTNAGIISNDGSPGTNGTAIAGGTGGINSPSHSLRQGINGVDGVLGGNNGNAGTDRTDCFGAHGGIGGNAAPFIGGASGIATPMPLTLDFFSRLQRPFDIPSAIAGTSQALFPNAGSASGASNSSVAGSGGSGAGGGIIHIVAASIYNTGIIRSLGGNAGSPFDDGALAVGGSSGGSGGLIFLYSKIIAIGTISVQYGVSSLGVNGGTVGGSFRSGYSFFSYNF